VVYIFPFFPFFPLNGRSLYTWDNRKTGVLGMELIKDDMNSENPETGETFGIQITQKEAEKIVGRTVLRKWSKLV
jgi:hypothetical protein